MSAEVREAAREIAAGHPGTVGRHWLAAIAALAAALFVIDTYLVVTHGLLFFDLPVEHAVQVTSWGPLVYVMDATNVTAGLYQTAFGLVVCALMFFWDRRAGWLMLVGSVASLLDQVLKASIERHRPTADLVTILTPSSGYSYPSGHAVFFTWLSFMLAFSLAPLVRPRLRPLLWVLAGFLTATACLGRVWAGAHWPSDVLGGLLLGLGWSAFVLWLPERWLPQPSRHWLRPR